MSRSVRRTRAIKRVVPKHSLNDPYSWWRTRHPASFDNGDVDRLHDAILAVPALLHINWPAAREGDFAVAIGVAIASTRTIEDIRRSSDIAMSVVLRNALCADQPSALIVAHVLQRLARIKPAYRNLATAWLDRLLEIR